MPDSLTSAATLPPSLPREGTGKRAGKRLGKRAGKRPVVQVDSQPDEPDPVPVSEALVSYDALSVYFSFSFHLITLFGVVGVLWALDLLYLQEDTVVDPLRAALADKVVLDDLPVMETLPLQIAAPKTIDIPQDSAVAIAESINEESINAPLMPDVLGGSEGGEGTASVNVWLPKGGNAVTKGSFTAWTVPESPTEGTPYAIVVEIKLPKRVRVYRLTDLSGQVVGTDIPIPYTQRLPWDSRRNTWPYMFKKDREYKVKRTERIRVKSGKVQLKIKVPGAANLVRDTITIRSETLKEQQQLELVFGSQKKRNRGTRRGPGGAGGAGGVSGGPGGFGGGGLGGGGPGSPAGSGTK